MSDTATKDPQEMVGEIALDERGDEIGEILGIYLQNGTRRPEWAAVEISDGELTLVPLVGANPAAEGVWLPLEAEEVRGAPARHTELPRQVSDDEATTLYRHYGSRSRQRPRGRRRSTAETTAPEEGAAAAAEQGRRVASAAAGSAGEVASTVTEEGQRVASTAVQEGQQVARTAVSQATGVAETAKEQVAEVGTELSNQARTLIHDTRTGIQDQAQSQTQAMADSMRRLGAEARALAEGRPEQAGVLAEYVAKAAERLTDMAGRIEERGPDGLVDDLRSFARSRPGTFVLGAAVAGFGVGRLLRSTKDDGDSSEEAVPAPPAMVAGGRRVR